MKCWSVEDAVVEFVDLTSDSDSYPFVFIVELFLIRMFILPLLNYSFIWFSSFFRAYFGATFVYLICDRVLLKFPEEALESDIKVFLSSFPRTAAIFAAYDISAYYPTLLSRTITYIEATLMLDGFKALTTYFLFIVVLTILPFSWTFIITSWTQSLRAYYYWAFCSRVNPPKPDINPWLAITFIWVWFVEIIEQTLVDAFGVAGWPLLIPSG